MLDGNLQVGMYLGEVDLVRHCGSGRTIDGAEVNAAMVETRKGWPMRLLSTCHIITESKKLKC
jgi:hypothetical protein